LRKLEHQNKEQFDRIALDPRTNSHAIIDEIREVLKDRVGMASDYRSIGNDLFKQVTNPKRFRLKDTSW
jgi:hypothetical protein